MPDVVSAIAASASVVEGGGSNGVVWRSDRRAVVETTVDGAVMAVVDDSVNGKLATVVSGDDAGVDISAISIALAETGVDSVESAVVLRAVAV